MKKIAITGVIASGKSEVCKLIESFGAKVIYTDKINAELLTEENYLKKLLQIFPDVMVNGTVDKKMIRSAITHCQDKREQLNALAHQEIKQRVELLMSKFNGKAIFCEIPLIVEANMQGDFDEIWCVVADFDTKVKRLMARDNVSKEDAIRIINCQTYDKVLIEISDKIITNNGNFDELKSQVQKFYNDLIK